MRSTRLCRVKVSKISMGTILILNAFNGNRTRVDPLEGGHSTTEL